ncbi:polysaccharide biosynthesis protein [Pseudogracilibacillus sp. SE30717A]|uniref:putative polysaccharide biosynthesis protein n=1 Tax=Pseudogracilibacillus sp. SE30717A TaxID=3098293 RepID=UPI00300E3F72
MDTITKRIVKGALLLTIAGLISKILSAAYRVPLQNLTGDLGFYIYQQVYPIIGTVMILSLYGFPVAVSKLTAEMVEERKEITLKHFYLPILIILFVINGGFFLLLFTLAPYIAEWIGDIKLQRSFQLAACLFLFIPFLSLLRGKFQGKEEMGQTALSQVVEQITRVSIIVSIAYYIYMERMNIYKIGEAGVIATMAGMSIAILTLSIHSLRRKEKQSKMVLSNQIPWKQYIHVCITLGVAASLNHLILIIIQFADVINLVPNLMKFGLSSIHAKETKGIFDRALPLIQFGVVFGSSFALALVPAVASKKQRQQGDHNLYGSIREAIVFSLYIALGATVGLVLLLPETNLLLFTNTDGTGSLQILVVSIVLTSISITGCAILQSLGFIKKPALWMVITFIIKYLLNNLFVPLVGIYGSAIATVGSLFFLCGMVLLTLKQKLPGLSIFNNVHWKALIIANGGMALYLILAKNILLFLTEPTRGSMVFYVPFLVVSGATIYLLLLLRFQAFTKAQLQALPYASFFINVQDHFAKRR